VQKSERTSVKFMDNVKEEKSNTGATKICCGHFGKQLSATRKDGRPYLCGFDKACTFLHVPIAGKSDDKLIEMASQMPASMKQDFLRAIAARKKWLVDLRYHSDLGELQDDISLCRGDRGSIVSRVIQTPGVWDLFVPIMLFSELQCYIVL
jgi:hypothetical protein